MNTESKAAVLGAYRAAILQAADYIEQHPDDFMFHTAEVPTCGTPGCAVGWTAHFLGRRDEEGFADVDNEMNGHSRFYAFMNDAVGFEWMVETDVCARGMRLFADKYFPQSEGDTR